MAQELEDRLRALRAEMTRLVQDGAAEDSLRLRRLSAELERLENQRSTLRGLARPANQGDTHVNLAA
jgi:uncharacterized small protein (DUF1192 family)